LAKLSEKLNMLAPRQGTPEGGRAFEDWFYDLISYFELPHRRPYVVDHREIDGSITIGDTTYLVELKFTTKPVGAPDVDVFRRKVESKADNTMGVMVSMSDYTAPAKKSASGQRSPILLLGFRHLYVILHGVFKMDELVSRVRQHASQTGRAFLEVNELG
ncbi:MAG: restriction endonuclease, partial [Rhodospirillaceae bacterium]|nr:restriction endonuclease [Rhodospirillaceae bacterium]